MPELLAPELLVLGSEDWGAKEVAGLETALPVVPVPVPVPEL